MNDSTLNFIATVAFIVYLGIQAISLLMRTFLYKKSQLYLSFGFQGKVLDHVINKHILHYIFWKINFERAIEQKTKYYANEILSQNYTLYPSKLTVFMLLEKDLIASVMAHVAWITQSNPVLYPEVIGDFIILFIDCDNKNLSILQACMKKFKPTLKNNKVMITTSKDIVNRIKSYTSVIEKITTNEQIT